MSDDRIKAITRHHPSRVPLSAGILPAAWMKHREALVTKYPLPTRESVRTFAVSKEDIGFPHGFMFLRLADLHGFEEIMVDCRGDVVNPQVGANGLDNLATVCKGKVCIALDLDRQKFPFWTPAEIDAQWLFLALNHNPTGATWRLLPNG